eukprot:CAMPEP_0117428064 /NCGR_PEP_ID=MMETSP0758-20121206/7853_1 /TAXON_ID=63605 /ORGANISM="Percolomonas cosmopolitus, Strain AE-1 (ATCC 50343)" /LENGTH=749 /DNA_ID=CAMNT_0005214209 /DNA_START=41 /DNA_END=2287 /DNA_ORIENTATION=+
MRQIRRSLLLIIVILVILIGCMSMQSIAEEEKEQKVEIKTENDKVQEVLDTIQKELENQNTNDPKKKPEIKLIRLDELGINKGDPEEMTNKIKELLESDELLNKDKVKMIKINIDDLDADAINKLDWNELSKQLGEKQEEFLKPEEKDTVKMISDWILKTTMGEKKEEDAKQHMGQSIKKLAEAFETHKEKGISSSPTSPFQLKRFTEKFYFEKMMKLKEQQTKDKTNDKTNDETKDETSDKTSDETNDETNDETDKTTEEEEKEENGLDNVLDRIQVNPGQDNLINIKKKYNGTTEADFEGLKQSYLNHAKTFVNDEGIAWYNLATLFGSSKYNQKNMSTYKDFLLLASTRGNPRAQFELAHLYENDFVSLEDHQRINAMLKTKVLSEESIDGKAMAFLNYYFAALSGHVKSQMVMGHRHFNGFQVKKSCQAAQVWYHMAATSVFNHMMSNHHFQLNDEKYKVWDEESYEAKHYNNAMEYVKYHASKGDTHSQMVYGYAQMFGLHGVDQNPHRAAEQFERALEAGAVEANGPLGQLYATGMGGFPQDNATAFDYFKAGADENDAVSLAGLGMMYLRGRGIPKDLNLAFSYLNTSAHLGNPQAQYHLGLMYLRGQGVSMSHSMAHDFFKLSAIQGTLPSQYQLGLLYLHGQGVSKSCSVAVKYFKHIAERGRELESLNRAFHHYRDGNFDDSLFLYSQLAETGDDVALQTVAYMFDHHMGVSPFYDLSRSLGSINDSFSYFADRQALKW